MSTICMYTCIIDRLYISVKLDLKERTEKDSGRQHIFTTYTYRGDRSVSWAAINHNRAIRTHTQEGHIEIVRERERETAIASTYAYDVMCSRLCLTWRLVDWSSRRKERTIQEFVVSFTRIHTETSITHTHTRNYSDLCIHTSI